MITSDPDKTSHSYRFRSFEEEVKEPSVPMEIATFIKENKALAAGVATAAFLVCAFMIGYGTMSAFGI
jgi:hypothetical protein